jgi:hypothetical protein
MELQLLGSAVNHAGDRFFFGKGVNIVLSDNPGLSSIFGCPANRVGHRKRPFNEAERAHQERYNEGKPYPWDNKVFAVYQVDWTQFKGDVIAGTRLQEGGCVSPGELSEVTIYVFAVDVVAGIVVSSTCSSYWASDKYDIPNWRKSLFQKYPDSTELKDLNN